MRRTPRAEGPRFQWLLGQVSDGVAACVPELLDGRRVAHVVSLTGVEIDCRAVRRPVAIGAGNRRWTRGVQGNSPFARAKKSGVSRLSASSSQRSGCRPCRRLTAANITKCAHQSTSSMRHSGSLSGSISCSANTSVSCRQRHVSTSSSTRRPTLASSKSTMPVSWLPLQSKFWSKRSPCTSTCRDADQSMCSDSEIASSRRRSNQARSSASRQSDRREVA